MYKIAYPKKHSEAEIQALLWYFLRKEKIDARLEVAGYNEKTGRKSCRLDLVVFIAQAAVCIVECKSWSDSYAKTYLYRRPFNTKQIRKYENHYNIPVLICGRMSFVVPTVNRIKQIIKKHHYMQP